MSAFNQLRFDEDFATELFGYYDNQYSVLWKTATGVRLASEPMIESEADELFFRLCETHGIHDVIKTKVIR